jgi:hypothetical protein
MRQCTVGEFHKRNAVSSKFSPKHIRYGILRTAKPRVKQEFVQFGPPVREHLLKIYALTNAPIFIISLLSTVWNSLLLPVKCV